MSLSIEDAMSLFGTLFNISIWAAGFICVAYVLAVVAVMGQRMKQIGQKLRMRGKR